LTFSFASVIVSVASIQGYVNKKKKGDERMKSELERLAHAAECAYQRQWRAEHKDRVKQYNRTYWEKKAAKRMEEANTDAAHTDDQNRP